MAEPFTVVGVAAFIVAVFLFAFLVGVAVPAILQLRTTLKSAERFLESTGRKADEALTEATEAMTRFNRATAGLEKGAEQLKSLFEAGQELAKSIGKLRDALKTISLLAGAIGPAAAAGFRAVFASGDGVKGTEASGMEEEPRDREAGASGVPDPKEQP